MAYRLGSPNSLTGWVVAIAAVLALTCRTGPKSALKSSLVVQSGQSEAFNRAACYEAPDVRDERRGDLPTDLAHDIGQSMPALPPCQGRASSRLLIMYQSGPETCI